MPKKIELAVLFSTLFICVGCQPADISRQNPYADPSLSGLPVAPVTFSNDDTALVIVDPQVDFLSPEGVAWGAVGESVAEHNVVNNIEALMSTAASVEIPMFVSPHYYFPHDYEWKFKGRAETLMHNIRMFERAHTLTEPTKPLNGADWMPQYKPYIEGESSVVTSPHKIYGPEQNDLVLQLRKRGINKVILAGMSANLCVQAHMHELLEQGFEVVVVRDATAGAKIPEGDGYLAALINFRFMASETLYTQDIVQRLSLLSQSEEDLEKSR